MLIYHIKTGSTYHDTDWLGTGYSGAGKTFAEGRNNINMISKVGKGPIPPGTYQIAKSRHSDHLGPVVMDLVASGDTETFGRSLFRIHGDNASNNASHGCIVLGRAIRDQISDWVNSGENQLTVTAE